MRLQTLLSTAVVPWLTAVALASQPWLRSDQGKAFSNPAPEYRPKFMYWLPDASISPDIVSKDIKDAKAVGAGGFAWIPFYLYGLGEDTYKRFAQQDPGYVVPELPDWNEYGFGTPAYRDLLKSSLKTVKEADMSMDTLVGANQGQGVPSHPGTPGLAVQLLMGNTTLSPKGGFSAPVPQPRYPPNMILPGLEFLHPLENYGTPNLTAVIAYHVLNQTKNATTGTSEQYLNESSFIDLTSKVGKGNTLQWTPPDLNKSWTIFTFWEAYTNQKSCDGGPNATTIIGNGSWAVDHFSATGAARVTDFWDEHILSDVELAELLKSIGGYAWQDSLEILASLYWTPGLLERFRTTYGYDLLPCVPVLFGISNTWNGILPVYDHTFHFGDASQNSVCQINYRTVLNDAYQEYLTHFMEWSHSIGLKYSAQVAYNLPLQMMSDIPLLDAPEGESLGFTESMDAYRQFTGPAHLANKSIISTELGAVMVPPYSVHIPELLQQIKRSFAGGFTMNVIHGFPSSTPYPNTTWPGYTALLYQFSEMWNQVQPAWHHMKDTLDYVGRTQWVLQQGRPQVDLAFYLYASPWNSRINKYNSTNLQDLGFTYDYIGPDNIVSSYAFVKDKMLGIPGYKALIFDQQAVTTVEAVKKLIEFSASGFPVVFIGSTPAETFPASSSDRDALGKAMAELLSHENVIQIDSVDELPSLLAKIGIHPRTPLTCSSNPVFTIRRSAGDVDYVYFFNDQPISTECKATFNTNGEVVPYIYNAFTGSQSRMSKYTHMNGSLSITLPLKSNETHILALHRSPVEDATCTVTDISEGLQSTNLTTWDLVIDDWHSAPDRFAVETEITEHTYQNVSLVPWSSIDSSLVPVSGIGHYTAQISVPSASGSTGTLVGVLNLPLIQHTARVYLDGACLGPIDPVNPVVQLKGLKPGAVHEIKVDVTTTLFNRIKADANETWVVGQVAGLRQPKYNSDPYQEYGLVGAVTLDWATEKVVSC